MIHQAWKPVIVYLNGQYWGHYNMRERVSRFFVAQHEGVPLEEADDMTILEANGKSYWGSNAEYSDLLKKAKTLSPGTNPEDLKYLTDRIDVDNYFAMKSGPSSPMRCRQYPLYKLGGNKWILFDLDYGLFN